MAESKNADYASDWSLVTDLDTDAKLAPLICGGIYETVRYGEPERFTCIATLYQSGKLYGRFSRYGVSDEQYEWTPIRASSAKLVWAPEIENQIAAGSEETTALLARIAKLEERMVPTTEGVEMGAKAPKAKRPYNRKKK